MHGRVHARCCLRISMGWLVLQALVEMRALRGRKSKLSLGVLWRSFFAVHGLRSL